MRHRFMAAIVLTPGLLVGYAPIGFAQALQPSDVAAIEKAAAEYVIKNMHLPQGDIAFDPEVFVANRPGAKRDAARSTALARALGATIVRVDSVYTCAERKPSTCRLAVATVVRVGEVVRSSEGARVVVEVRKRTINPRQPVARATDELILAKQGNTWSVIGVGSRSAS